MAKPEKQFVPFEYGPDGLDGRTVDARLYASYLDRSMKVMLGARTLLEVLHWDEGTRSNWSPGEPEPVLGPFETGALLGFVTESIAMLRDDAEERMDHLAKNTRARSK